jgi:hypothetical protein
MPSPLDNPYFKAALEQVQQDRDIAARQQQDYNNRLLQLDKSKADALSQVESSLSALPEQVRGGAGIKWESDVARRRIERDAEFAKIALTRGEKGNDELISMIKAKYPEGELKPFEDTQDFQQANTAFRQIMSNYKVANVLNQQLKTAGEDLVQMKEAYDKGDVGTGNAMKEQVRRYAITSLTQNLSNSVNPNAQQRDEFIRQAESLIDPALVAAQGGNFKQMLGTGISKALNFAAGSKEKDAAVSSIADTLGAAMGANPEEWYKTAQKANKDLQTRQEKELLDQVVNKVGIYHAEKKIGAYKPVIYDPLADYIAAKAQQKKELGFGMVEQPIDRSGAPTLSTGAGSTIPVQSGTMQSGTVSGSTMMPTSRPRTKFTVLTPQ